MKERTIGFVGAGQMAQALARGFVTSNIVRADLIRVYDPNQTALEAFLGLAPNAKSLDSNQAVIQASDVVLVAVKPQYLQTVFRESKNISTDQVLVVSVVAGATCARLTGAFRTDRVIRVMPNMPALVGSGAAGYCRGAGATEQDAEFVGELLSGVGISVELPERLLDAVTGLSGSGPAFVFQFIEALADGGVRMGLPRDIAQSLALHTVRGAADLAIKTEAHPAVLKDRVASPGGTTIEGLHALETGGFRATVMDAVSAAARRSEALANG